MRSKTATRILAALAVFTVVMLLPPREALEGKKKSLFEQLELMRIAYVIGKYQAPFTREELEELQRAMPSLKADNPKLYKDRKRTEKILLLYMVLEEIKKVQTNGAGLETLVGKSRGQVARDYVKRVYKTE